MMYREGDFNKHYIINMKALFAAVCYQKYI